MITKYVLLLLQPQVGPVYESLENIVPNDLDLGPGHCDLVVPGCIERPVIPPITVQTYVHIQPCQADLHDIGVVGPHKLKPEKVDYHHLPGHRHLFRGLILGP